MINAAMFFALGALTAGLLVLLVGPAVWRRAVRLTRRAVEATTPMSLAEVHAARDQLRAEYAVETRRLELARTALSDKVVRQQVELSDGREMAKSLTADRDEQLQRIDDAAEREKSLRDELRRKEDDLARLSTRIKETESDLKRRSQQFVELSQKLSRDAASGTRTDHATDGSPDLARMESEIATQKARQTTDAAKILSLESELSQLRRRYAALEDTRTGITSAPTARVNGSRNDTAVNKLEGLVIDLEGQTVEAQAEITRLSLQLESMRGSNGDNMEGALVSLEAENTALAEELNRTAVERGRVESQLKRMQETDAHENYRLREEITQLAAQVAAAAATAEGKGSKIDQILAQDTKVKTDEKNGSDVSAISGSGPLDRRNGGIAGSAATANRASGPSLAERIRGIRQSESANGSENTTTVTPLHPR